MDRGEGVPIAAGLVFQWIPTCGLVECMEPLLVVCGLASCGRYGCLTFVIWRLLLVTILSCDDIVSFNVFGKKT